MTHQQALAVRNGIQNILNAFDETDYKVAISHRPYHKLEEYEVHIYAVEKEKTLYKAAFLWRALEEILGGVLSIESNYNVGTTECDFRESFKIW